MLFRSLVAQLAPGGRIVIPIGGFTGQTMSRFTKTGDDLVQENLGLFAFVPLVGEYGQRPASFP